ncbi:MAG: VOC family protein [Actinobacteria bacterium]|nr:VOC family protein [Actinomycetota bacterium]
MAEVSSYAPGTPSWVDLATSDPEGARSFYGRLFGWGFEVGPPETGHYTMCQLRGRNVAGMAGEPSREGVPTAWTTYMATDDADEVARRITEAGGTVLMGPMDVMSQGRLIVAGDPAGALFGVWQAGDHAGASLVDEPGSLVWSELATRDLAAAQVFYTQVFGYGWEAVDTGEGGPAYQVFSVDGRTVGGAMQMTADWPEQIPSHWMTYFAVADTEAAAAAAQDLGGTMRVSPTDSPYGRFAVLGDPQGAVFTVMQSTGVGG